MKNKLYIPAFLAIGALFVMALVFISSSNIVVPEVANTAAVIQAIPIKVQNPELLKIQTLVTQVSTLRDEIMEINNAYSKNVKVDEKAKADTLLNQLTQKAEERKTLVMELMRRDPRLFHAVAIKKSERATLPTVVQTRIEQEDVSLTGEITTIHVDDFTNEKNDHFEYFILADQKKYALYPTLEVPLLSGTVVKIQGYVIDDQISIDVNVNLPITVRPPPPPDSVGNQRTLVLLVKPFANAAEPFTPLEGQNLVFHGQFQNFMQEQSYHKVSFSGDVYGWLVLGKGVEWGCNLDDSELVTHAVDTYGLNLDNYDRIVYLYTYTFGGCSHVGKSSFIVKGKTYRVSQSSIGLDRYNLPSEWGSQSFPWTNLDYVLSHELGHSLGTLHSNGWSCIGQILYGDCEHIEYGNYFDTMGEKGFSLNYNAYFKEQLGWISPDQVLGINHSGSYTLNPQELVNGVKLAKVNIQNTALTPYAIESRIGVGFDSNLNQIDIAQNQQGIFIHRIPESGAPATELLDMSPTYNPTIDRFTNFYNSIKSATLNLPAASSSVYSFIDSGRGITIGPVTQVSTSSISFNVDLTTPICERSSPTTLDLPQSEYVVVAGGLTAFTQNFSNADYYGCGASQFNGSLVLPTSWTYTVSPVADITLLPGKSGSKSFVVRIPVTVPAGSYSATIDIQNKTSGLHKLVTVQIRVLEPLRITDINPLFGPSGIPVTITGTGFDPSVNDVSMSGAQGWTDPVALPSASGKIVYTIPNTVHVCNPLCHSIPTPSGEYGIKVLTHGSSVSSSYFLDNPPINPSLMVISPGRGEVCTVGQDCHISWTSNGSYPDDTWIALYVMKEGREIYNLLTAKLDEAGNTFTWNISPSINVREITSGGMQFRLRVRIYNHTTGQMIISDDSDPYFSITPIPSRLKPTPPSFKNTTDSVL